VIGQAESGYHFALKCNRWVTYWRDLWLQLTRQQDRIFLSIADPSRRRILDMLAHRERPVGRIAEQFAMSRPAVIKHLRVLRSANISTRSTQRRSKRFRVGYRNTAPGSFSFSNPNHSFFPLKTDRKSTEGNAARMDRRGALPRAILAPADDASLRGKRGQG
jgi:DNA-binding transcriptional ArsR family regulator